MQCDLWPIFYTQTAKSILIEYIIELTMLSFYGLKNKLKIKCFLNMILAMCYTANNSL